MEKGEEGIMKKEPRDPKEPIVDKRMKVTLAFQSVALALGALVSFYVGYRISNEDLVTARTFCFTTLILGEMLRAFSARSETISIFRMKIFENGFLNWSVCIAIVLLFIVVYFNPLQPIFSTTDLRLNYFLIALALAFLPVFGGEIAKGLKD
jgi:Ca2+-transporting ATPase